MAACFSLSIPPGIVVQKQWQQASGICQIAEKPKRKLLRNHNLRGHVSG